MDVHEYVWRGLSWRRNLVGREVVDALVNEAMHSPISSGPAGEAIAAEQIAHRVADSRGLGMIVLSYLIPYLAAEIVKLVLKWLATQSPPMGVGAPYRPSIEG
jgi:hypothetical protein